MIKRDLRSVFPTLRAIQGLASGLLSDCMSGECFF
jgi:hypothetical protein